MPSGCLIIEDEALIALALEASLEEAGVAVAGVFGTKAGALGLACEEYASDRFAGRRAARRRLP